MSRERARHGVADDRRLRDRRDHDGRRRGRLLRGLPAALRPRLAGGRSGPRGGRRHPGPPGLRGRSRGAGADRPGGRARVRRGVPPRDGGGPALPGSDLRRRRRDRPGRRPRRRRRSTCRSPRPGGSAAPVISGTAASFVVVSDEPSSAGSRAAPTAAASACRVPWIRELRLTPGLEWCRARRGLRCFELARAAERSSATRSPAPLPAAAADQTSIGTFGAWCRLW